jgi:hypothetical protein
MTKRDQAGALVFSTFLAVAALAASCDAPTPASPSYAADVRPIFMSRCVRCHGSGPDGGTLRMALEPTGPNAAALASDPTKPTTCYLDQYADSGDCPDAGGSTLVCHRGAYHCATMVNGIDVRVHGGGPIKVSMPPPPSSGLDDWELKVVDAWTRNPLP